jgi:hypothetical protein
VKASGRFFEKKRRKKLLLCWGMGVGGAIAHDPRAKSLARRRPDAGAVKLLQLNRAA